MNQIIITEKTKNPKTLRKRIYKRALDNIKNKRSCGFCSAIVFSIDNQNSFYPERDKFVLMSINNVYEELLKYKPKRPYNCYWFPIDEKGKNKRIKILEEIISNM